MTRSEFTPIYKDLVAICGERHADKDLNTRHLNGMLQTLERWDAGIVKKAVARVRSEFGRTQYEARWPTPGKLAGVCEDIHQGTNQRIFEPDKSFDQRLQEAELMRIDEAIAALPQAERWSINVEAANRLLEEIFSGLRDLGIRDLHPPSRNGQSDEEWVRDQALAFQELQTQLRVGNLQDTVSAFWSTRMLMLSNETLLRCKIRMTMRSIAKERGIA